MEVADKGSNSMENVGVDSNRTISTISWDKWVILGTEVKTSKFRTGGFASPSEEDSVIWTI